MPTTTYTPLANITLGSSASSVTFSNIPSTYRDLVLVVNGTTSVNADIGLRFNSDSAANYSFVYMGGNGSTTASGSSGSQSQIVLNAYAWRSSERTSCIINIMDYSATDKHKTVLSRNNVAGAGVDAFANRWANTNAITQVAFIVATGGATLSSGSTLSLYGVIA